MEELIHIFHTNDLHSHFNNWPRMTQFIQAERARLAALGETAYLIDIGDHIDRSDTFTEATLGKGVIELLNEAGYDAVTIGNNEGITLSHEELAALYEQANFDVLVGNLSSLDGHNPEWLKPYSIFITQQGTRIALIGVTAAYPPFYNSLSWSIDEPRSVAAQLVYLLRDQVDIILCLSHLGKVEDELLARECPDIDVIFGAHTHHVFPSGQYVGDVLLTGGGKFGHFLGHLTLKYDKVIKKITKKNECLIDNSSLPVAAHEKVFIEKLFEHGKNLLNQPLFEATTMLNREWFHYSRLSDFFAKAIIEETGADCALFNAGIFLDSMPKGKVSAYDMHKILPHPINLCVVEVSGAELKEVLLQSQNEEWPLLELKGLGFRGVIFGKMLAYGFKMDEHRQLFVNGRLVEHDEVINLVTLDMFTFGYFFPMFRHAKKHYILPKFIRHIVAAYGEKYFCET